VLLEDSQFSRKKVILRNLFFLVPYFFVVILSAFAIYNHRKTDIHAYLNQFYHEVFDFFFKYFTHLGDGIFVLLFTIIALLFISKRMAFIISINAIGSGIITQLLKKYVYHDSMRPAAYMDIPEWREGGIYRLVEGVEMNSFHSFPSGHTTGAFALLFSICLYSKNKWVKLSCFIIAALVGYSRVYLSQHYLEDVVAGSLIAVSFSLLAYLILYKSLYAKKWLNGPLIKLSK